jgi:membrane-associated phospholipid phosphatase
MKLLIKPVICVVVLLFVLSNNSFAQRDTTKAPSLADTIHHPDRPYTVLQFLHETHLLVKRPLEWKGKQWLMFGGMTVGTAISTAMDQPMRDATQGEQKFYHSIWVEGGRTYGEWYMIPGMFAAFETYGIISGSRKSKTIAIELLQAGLFSEASTYFLKISLGRSRPLNNEGNYSFRPFTFSNDLYHSFPSGHNTSAWAMSAVIAGTAKSDIVKILAYVPCGFTMFSRIYQDYHWISDSFAGAFIGYFVGNWVVDLHNEQKHKIEVTSIFPPTFTVYLDSKYASK